MKKVSKIILCIFILFVLAGCASEKESGTSENGTEENSMQVQTETNDDTAEPDEISKQEETDKNAEDEGTEKAEQKTPNEFTQEEKNFFTDFMNNIENNGFLQSEYTEPADADLYEVFYNGAGVSAHSLTDEEEAAYEEETGWGIYTDVERLTTEDIDNFLLRKTGCSLAEMNNSLNWIYLEEFDVYVFDHGDTNRREYSCTGGRKDGDIYEIYYEAAHRDENDDGGVLTLKKSGDDFLFVSNNWDYVPDLSRLSENEIKQLEVFAENKDIWNMEDYEPMEFYYTVFDLDYDGRPELITSVNAGTGIFAENHFYHTDDEFTELEEIPQEYYDEYSELDIDFNSDGGEAYTDGDIIYYPTSDISKNGAAEHYNFDGAYYIRDGVVHSVIYRGTYILWHDEDNLEQTWYDADGNEITEEEWEKLEGEFFADMDKIAYDIVWKSIGPSELKTASSKSIFRILAESYQGY